MSDGSWLKSAVRCPFYKSDNTKRKSIRCEGVFDRSQVTHTFRRKRDWQQQLTLFCCANYQHCEICHVILMAKYPDE